MLANICFPGTPIVLELMEGKTSLSLIHLHSNGGEQSRVMVIVNTIVISACEDGFEDAVPLGPQSQGNEFCLEKDSYLCFILFVSPGFPLLDMNFVAGFILPAASLPSTTEALVWAFPASAELALEKEGFEVLRVCHRAVRAAWGGCSTTRLLLEEL